METSPVEIMDVTVSGSTGSHESTQALPEEVADDVTPDADASNFRQVSEKMCQLNERFQSTPAATAKILKRLNRITTATQWETFLQTQGARVSRDYRSASTIGVRPTARSRRRPVVTRGSKRITVESA